MKDVLARMRNWRGFRKQLSSWQFLIWGMLAFGLQYIQIPFVFNLQDDFWLWYGVQRLATGEIPIRDFQSYDAGRYVVTLLFAFGQDGLFGVRLAQATIGALIVGLGVWFVQRRSDVSPYLLVLTAVVLFTWLFPRHKFYDIAISVVNVLFVWMLLDRQTRALRLMTGMMVVVSLLVNRNHALYLVVALGMWLVWQFVALPTSQRLTLRQFAEFVMGGLGAAIVVGVIVALIPGYIDAYYRHNILIFLEAGATNLARPITWPWQVDVATIFTIKGLRSMIFAWMLVLMIGAGVFGLVWEYWHTRRTQQIRPQLLAPALFILPYSHHVFSRTGVTHYAQGVFPLVLFLAVFAVHMLIDVSTSRWKSVGVWTALTVWVVASLVVAYPQQPVVRCAGSCEPVEFAEGQTFWVDKGTRNDYELLQSWLEKYQATQSFAVYSQRPGLYAMNGIQAPVYHTYIAYRISDDKQKEEIADIDRAGVRMIIIGKMGVDGRADTAFRNTNAMTFAHIQANYTVVEYTKHYEAYLRNEFVP